MTKKTFNSPDETRGSPKGKVEPVTVGSDPVWARYPQIRLEMFGRCQSDRDDQEL